MTHLATDIELPVGSIGRHANGWWGMVMLIVTEASLFAYLLFSYYYLAVQHGRDWLPPQLPGFGFSIPSSILLILSAVAVWRGERNLVRGERAGMVALYLGIAALLGVGFVVLQAFEWSGEPFVPATNAFASLYYTVSAFHVLHEAAGVVILAALTLWTALGYFDRSRNAAVSIGALYWYFVLIAWLAVFFTFYISPRLNVG